MNDGGERTLREKTREAIRAGTLPARIPEYLWGGKGEGRVCVICNAAITPAETEFEVEFAGEAGGSDKLLYRMHLQCFAAWEAELREAEIQALRIARGEPRPTGPSLRTAHDGNALPESPRPAMIENRERETHGGPA